MATVRFHDVTHTFPDGSTGLDSVSFRLSLTGLTVLSGLNGSGKTVLARHLCGLLSPTSGVIELHEHDHSHHPDSTEQRRKRIGMVFQDADSQLLGQTVAEDIGFGPRNLGLPHDEITRRTDYAARLMGLEELRDRDPHFLSGGEKRRLAIAGVLALQRDFIILDEPFSDLDFPGVRRLLRYILSLLEAGTGILVIVHDIDKVLAHADRVLLLDQGRLAADGPPGELLPILGHFGLGPIRGRLCEMTWLG